jgi:hypothetical protein
MLTNVPGQDSLHVLQWPIDQAEHVRSSGDVDDGLLPQRRPESFALFSFASARKEARAYRSSCRPVPHRPAREHDEACWRISETLRTKTRHTYPLTVGMPLPTTIFPSKSGSYCPAADSENVSGTRRKFGAPSIRLHPSAPRLQAHKQGRTRAGSSSAGSRRSRS